MINKQILYCFRQENLKKLFFLYAGVLRLEARCLKEGEAVSLARQVPVGHSGCPAQRLMRCDRGEDGDGLNVGRGEAQGRTRQATCPGKGLL